MVQKDNLIVSNEGADWAYNSRSIEVIASIFANSNLFEFDQSTEKYMNTYNTKLVSSDSS